MSVSTHFVGGRPPTDSGKNRILFVKGKLLYTSNTSSRHFPSKSGTKVFLQTYQDVHINVHYALYTEIFSLQSSYLFSFPNRQIFLPLIKSSDKYLHCKQGTMFLLLDLALPLCATHTFTACLHKVSQTKVFPSCCHAALGCLPAGREPSPGLNGVRLRRPRNSRLLTSAGYPQDSGLPPLSLLSHLPLPRPSQAWAQALPLSLQEHPHCKVPKRKCYFRCFTLGSNVCSIKALKINK